MRYRTVKNVLETGIKVSLNREANCVAFTTGKLKNLKAKKGHLVEVDFIWYETFLRFKKSFSAVSGCQAISPD